MVLDITKMLCSAFGGITLGEVIENHFVSSHDGRKGGVREA